MNGTDKRKSIASICTCGGYNQFRKFCETRGIVWLHEVTPEHLEVYRQLKGVGAMKYKLVKDEIEAYERTLNNSEKEFLI